MNQLGQIEIPTAKIYQKLKIKLHRPREDIKLLIIRLIN